MRLLRVKNLPIPEIKVIRFGRFNDHRGYFTETFRKSDFQEHPEMSFVKGIEFTQANESFSKAGVFRGFHFQWNPYMGKLVRPLFGHMIDFILDIRKGSPTFGKAVAYDLPVDSAADWAEWIWVPPGFAHGVLLVKESLIEYLCSGQYSPGCEAIISPLASDIDWSLCDPVLKETFDSIAPITTLMTDKDRNGFTLEGWMKDERSENFNY